MAVSWRNKWVWDTGYSADSVEWCPVPPHLHALVCGTYQLDNNGLSGEQPSNQKRLGRIYLFVIDKDTTELTPVQTIDTSGILDQKWCYHSVQGHTVLAAVTSDGFLQLYRLADNNGALSLKLWLKHSIGHNVLALSLDWSTNRTESGEPSVVISDSWGRVTVLKVAEDGLKKVGVWKAHGYEAWTAAFDYWNTDVFYSGGDDGVFKSYDVRAPEAVATNRSHKAGVTAVRSHAHVEHQLVTGSYDEKVRLWDARNLENCITETDVRGGVWRLKYHPFQPDTVLAACMYGGFRVLKLGQDIAMVGEYSEHGSIAYGADWKFDHESSMVATCSFYDCKMHIGEVLLK